MQFDRRVRMSLQLQVDTIHVFQCVVFICQLDSVLQCKQWTPRVVEQIPSDTTVHCEPWCAAPSEHELLCLVGDWIGLCSVLCPHQHSIGYMGDGFYRSKDPTNSIKVLKENLQRKKVM